MTLCVKVKIVMGAYSLSSQLTHAVKNTCKVMHGWKSHIRVYVISASEPSHKSYFCLGSECRGSLLRLLHSQPLLHVYEPIRYRKAAYV